MRHLTRMNVMLGGGEKAIYDRALVVAEELASFLRTREMWLQKPN
jgi:hypothetical protein